MDTYILFIFNVFINFLCAGFLRSSIPGITDKEIKQHITRVCMDARKRLRSIGMYPPSQPSVTPEMFAANSVSAEMFASNPGYSNELSQQDTRLNQDKRQFNLHKINFQETSEFSQHSSQLIQDGSQSQSDQHQMSRNQLLCSQNQPRTTCSQLNQYGNQNQLNEDQTQTVRYDKIRELDRKHS